MSEDKFSVPIKKPIDNKRASKKSSPDKVQKKVNQEKGTKNKNTKNGGTKKAPPALNSIPDMGLLPPNERHSLILGKEIDRKPKAKANNNERSVKLDTIKKAQVANKANFEIPKIGKRKAVKTYPIIPIIFILLIIMVFVSFILALSYFKDEKALAPMDNNIALTNSSELVLNIEKGMSAFQVASQLSSIFDQNEFLAKLKERGLDGALQVGKYKISSENSIEDVILAITSKATAITIYDGQDILTIDKMLNNKGFIKRGEFIKECELIAKDKNLPFSEGWFLSGSYTLDKKNCAKVLANDMHNALLSYIRANSDAFNNSEYSLNDILIIASMVQRETQDESQMPLISSVIFNRLKHDMPLGIDATTRYEINDWKNDISKEIYDKITPYNTRRKKGLPPTGIGCVSKKALDAVLNPASTDYLYYRHGKDGKLYLSKTYKEHLSLDSVAKDN